MDTITILVAFLVSTVTSTDLTFVSDTGCTGRALYGGRDLPTISCYNITYLDPTKSVILANVSPEDKVTFFSDTACQNELYSSSQDLCYTEPDSQVRSFQIHTNDMSPDTATATTDVVPYGVRLSNYKGLSQSSPFDIDLNFSRFAIGIVLSIGATFITMSTVATGCARTDSTDVLDLYGCIAAPVATGMNINPPLQNLTLKPQVIAWVGAYLVASGASRVGSQAREGFNMALGVINDVKVKRDLIDQANSNFMSTLMERDDGNIGEHVGFQTRDMGNGVEQRSPLYEVDGLDGKNTNGLDFTVCPFGGSTSGWSSDPVANWQTAYDQFMCQVPQSSDGGLSTTATNVEIDLYNEAATVIGSVQIVGYSGSTTVNPPVCSNPGAFSMKTVLSTEKFCTLRRRAKCNTGSGRNWTI